MAKSIRLKSLTQARVENEVRRFKMQTRAELSDAYMVDLLVNEALDAREKAEKQKAEAEKQKAAKS